MSVPSSVGPPPVDLNLGRRPPRLGTSSEDRHRVGDVVAVSPWRLRSKIRPAVCRVLPPLQPPRQPEAALGLVGNRPVAARYVAESVSVQ